MPNIFLSLHPFYERGPIMGRKQANMGFINALFRKDPFELYHFYVDEPQSLINIWHEEPDAAPLLQRGALHAFARTHLEKRLRVVPYSVCHFSDPMTEFAAMCRVRNAIAPTLFPVTAVNHTISYKEYAESTLGHIWQGCTVRDGIGCTSNASRTIMQAWYDHARNVRNIPDDWHQPVLKNIPLGVPEPSLSGNEGLRESFRQSLNLDPKTPLILIYGRISVTDKMDVRPFINALRRIRSEYPELNFCLVIAGAMDDDEGIKEQLEQLTKAWDIDCKVIAHPSREVKKQLFAAADIFASPVDNIQETFGLTLIEAAQAGIPVIASDWDGYKDIVVQNTTGLLVPTLAPTHTPRLDTMVGVLYNKIHQLFRSQQTAIHVPKLAEALHTLMANPALRKQMGKEAQKRAATRYTFDAVVDTWIDFWQELAAAPISQEQEKRIRAAKHPYALDFGKTFAAYSTHELHSQSLLQCTDLGRAFLEKKAPWNNFGLVAVNINEQLITALVGFAQQSCTLEQLMTQADTWRKNVSDEALLAHVYWLVKQDLLECVDG